MTDDSSFEGHRRRIDRRLLLDSVADCEERVWYVAGPLDFVASINHILRAQLRLRDIKLEVFTGY